MSRSVGQDTPKSVPSVSDLKAAGSDELFYGWSKFAETIYSDGGEVYANPVIVPSEFHVDQFQRLGENAICVAGTFTREHLLCLRKMTDITLAFLPYEMRQELTASLQRPSYRNKQEDAIHFEDWCNKSTAKAGLQEFLYRAYDTEYSWKEDAEDQKYKFIAKPFVWGKLSEIPTREWVYGQNLIRGHVSVVVAPGGLGKSSLIIGEAVAMATGKQLFGVWTDPRPQRVWYWNLEDTTNELRLRVLSFCQYHGVSENDLSDHLFVNSRDDKPLCVSDSRGIVEPIYENVKNEILRRKIDVLIIDPFVSSHRINENDNGAMDEIAKRWARLAGETNCAITLVHHARKTVGEISAESSRGGVALVGAARDLRVLNRMSESEATTYGIENHLSYFRVQSGKANLAPIGKPLWYRFESLDAGNGTGTRPADSVGVVDRFRPQNALNKITPEMVGLALDRLRDGDGRHNMQSPEWAGHLVASILEIDTETKLGRRLMNKVFSEWEYRNLIQKVDKEGPDRKSRPYWRVVE